ncbi:anhydro-N-acetylmuramic acid kinase [Robiginitalea myxolifaciens]|uniref:Anhydro-N-acetylmuramic acid kinase n=1 Tax=Robiginitalea myxolifaciens TaxID=400055 RepID=A0A1I6FN96_9FLAO|nr:anhydro-N-acetylmuramic acid kinase [Robiginitalea myxolifaciens]SFR31390.1 anhydro-N-acetylmuramic acid kinase [Robiginitalea myxolifaciens]
MEAKTYRILGMMSGTSLDGLDMVLADLDCNDSGWTYRILEKTCIDYSPGFKNKLQEAIALDATSLLAFHAEYGRWLGKQAREFLDNHQAVAHAIASHGHTIHHRPESGFTFQLGAPQELALEAGIPVIGDFRSLDVALGGQGAPLVPLGDRLLFPEYDFCLNLGGISNVSFEAEGNRLAYDIGIANMLLNYLCREEGLEYDKGGAIAREGQLIPALQQALDSLEYYRLPYPKSTGYEWFRDAMIPILKNHPGALPDLLHTAVAHIAAQIGKQINNLISNTLSSSERSDFRLLITGGGARNTYLIERIQASCGAQVAAVIPDPEVIDYKEALVFALLGALRLEGQPNVLASVTGASRSSCSGVVYLP